MGSIVGDVTGDVRTDVPRQPAANPWNPAAVAVDNCEREPIHTPNLIQPSGGLIAFEPGTGQVLHASANLGRWFPGAAGGAVGKQLAQVVGQDTHAMLQQALASTTDGGRHRAFEVPARPGGAQTVGLQGLAHRHQGLCIAEFEPTHPSTVERGWQQSFRDAIEALSGATDLDDVVQRMAAKVRRLIGFDRVMVYRFAPDWHGQVMADSCEEDMVSFKQMHFPASDIPPQARELYRANLVRYIPDVDYTPGAMLAADDLHALGPLDMSFAVLRSVSPMHLQYLRNMGVRSTLVISLMVEGQLWGLIAGHHRTPTALPMGLRNACNVLSTTAGFTISGAEQRARDRAAAKACELAAALSARWHDLRVPTRDVVDQCAGALLQVVGASGGALWQAGQLFPFGHWPDGECGTAIVASARLQLEASGRDLFSTDHVAAVSTRTKDASSGGWGLMAIRLDAEAAAGIVWLRPEHRQQMDWGGDPDAPAQVTLDASGQPYLTPRASFARWEHEFEGRCRAWSAADQAAARSLLTLRQALLLRSTLAKIDLGEQRFSRLVALQSDIYWQTDAQGRLVVLSRPLPCGHGPAAGGLTLPELLAESCDATTLDALGRAFSGSAPIGPLRVSGHTAAGERVDLQLGGEPIRDALNQVVGWHGTIADLTQEIAAQEAQRAREAAELTSIAKTRFLSQVSHELQTPLTTVIGFSELLLLDASLTPVQREPLQLIRKAGAWLQAMIGDLLDLSRVETGNLRVTLADVVVRPLIDDALELVRIQAADKDMHFVVDGFQSPLTVRADPVRLKQVLLNLATNAVKYSHPSSTVTISVTPDRARGRVRIAMKDTGLGMSAEQRAQLFQPFNRLGRETGQTAGAGIGLVLAKHLVEAMDGALAVETVLGRGSCFSVSLALVQPVRAAARDRIERSMAHARSRGGVGCAVLMIHCDRFGQSDDAPGHAVGDDVLDLIEERLRRALRSTAVASREGPADRGDALVARLSGDEFVVVLDRPLALDEAHGVAQRLLDVTTQPCTSGGHPVRCSIGIGVAPGAPGSGDAETVLQHASLAMAEARRAGGSRCVFFEPTMSDRALHRGDIESDLRRALLEDERFVEYQPVVELQHPAADAAQAGCADEPSPPGRPEEPPGRRAATP